jgi:hypothetical protein
MRRILLTGVLGLFCAVPLSYGQQHNGNIQFHGPPPSVTSPGWNGGLRNGFASVTDPGRSPVGRVPQFHVSPQFGKRHFRGHDRFHHRGFVPVYVPYYDYGYGYPYAYDPSAYDQMSDQEVSQSPVAQPPSEPQVIIVREQPASPDSRYGEHSFDAHEESPPATQSPTAPTQPAAEELPVTTLVYRDGHKSEVRNYAIVGSNLIDLSHSPLMKRIPLSSLDLDATRHENEENGVDFHLP